MVKPKLEFNIIAVMDKKRGVGDKSQIQYVEGGTEPRQKRTK